jgi:two-component system, NarL family, invasion response regulator UvrY
LRILLADDHDLMRLGSRRFIEAAFENAQVEEAQTARQTLDMVMQQSWDLLLLDLGLPDKNGLDILRDIKLAQPNLPVLVFSGAGEDEFAVAALHAGASGFLPKALPAQELAQAIKKVLAGGTYLTPTLADKLALASLSKTSGPLHESLSEREFQVLRMIASGHSATAIAASLSLSVPTVSTYRARLLRKMGMSSNAELTHYAIKQRLVG